MRTATSRVIPLGPIEGRACPNLVMHILVSNGAADYICDRTSQLDAIERCIELWTNPGDLVYDPFGGIGSVPYQAVKMGRRGVGCELKESYYIQACKNLEIASQEAKKPAQIALDAFEAEAETSA